MTDHERREGRYERRHESRDEHWKEIALPYDFENMLVFSKWIQAEIKCYRGVGFKFSTQQDKLHIIKTVIDNMDSLKNIDIRMLKLPRYYEFNLVERGKPRHIAADRIRVRGMVKTILDECLLPIITRHLVFENHASLPEHGIDLAIEYVTEYLVDAYRKYGDEAYILIADYHDYFKTINHNMVINQLKDFYIDEWTLDVVCASLARERDLNSEHKPIGLSLGCENNQIFAVMFATPVDQYMHNQLHLRGERYMDDSFYVCPNREIAEKALHEFVYQSEKLGLQVNMKKTRIVNIREIFRFLKIDWEVTETGKIIRHILPETVNRRIRVLNSYRRLYDKGEMTRDSIEQSFKSYTAYLKRFDSRGARNMLVNYYYDIFPEFKVPQVETLYSKREKTLLVDYQLTNLLLGQNQFGKTYDILGDTLCFYDDPDDYLKAKTAEADELRHSFMMYDRGSGLYLPSNVVANK